MAAIFDSYSPANLEKKREAADDKFLSRQYLALPTSD